MLVDFHAEATSEKVAMGWYLDGRVTAVVGTHTHVPTADARVLPGGTAYITDVGMTGPRGGVIGVDREQAVRGFVTHMRERFETSDDDPWLMGVLIRAIAADAGRRDRADPAACAGHSPSRTSPSAASSAALRSADDQHDPGLPVDEVEVAARELDLRQRDARGDERAGQRARRAPRRAPRTARAR